MVIDVTNQINMSNQIKQWIKSSPLIVKIKRKVWAFFYGSSDVSKLNVNKTFPSFPPFSAGTYKDRAILTIEAINQVFPFLSSLSKHLKDGGIVVEKIESLSIDPQNKSSSYALKKILDKHGSDKANHHNYHHLYGAILCDKDSVTNIFEVGLGTNYTNVVSNMGPQGKPGASLRAFRDFCPNAQVFGADIDKRILFEEDRIKTFFVDQTKPATFDALLEKIPKNFDLVIDDGLHSPNANIATLEFGLKILKIGGWVVIEDIGEEAISIWQTVSALFPNSYEPHIFSADGAILFAVKKLN